MKFLLSFQHTRTNHCPYLRTSKSANSAKQQQKQDNNNTNLSWLESWMVAKPWENRLLEQAPTERPEMTPLSSAGAGFRSNSSEHSTLKPKRNNKFNLTTHRMYPRSPGLVVGRISRSSSGPGSDFLYDGSSESTSSSSNTNTGMEMMEENNQISRPNYMNLTESIKAKQKQQQQASKYAPPSPRSSMEESQLQMKSMTIICNGETRSSAGSYTPSAKLSKDLYPPVQMDRLNWIKSKNCLF